MLAGLRFVIAGAVTYAFVRARGAPPPTRTEWRSSLIVGSLLVCANACVVIAEQWVSSDVAAVAIASVPLWVALVAGLRALAFPGRMGRARDRSRRRGHPSDRGRPARQPRGRRGPDGELPEL